MEMTHRPLHDSPQGPFWTDRDVDTNARELPDGQRRKLHGRLIHAHEQERFRIARELHDGFAQRIAVLALELEMLARGAHASDIHERLAQLSFQVKELGSDLHRVSHELHPVKLHLLGLEAAIRSLCTQLSTTHHLSIRLDVHDVPHPLSHDSELCVYRIAQEALNNVVRHSGALNAQLTLCAVQGNIVLVVADNGSGFNREASRMRGSLGLTSMRERVELIDGRFSLHTKEGEGTRIEVRVPVRLKQDRT